MIIADINWWGSVASFTGVPIGLFSLLLSWWAYLEAKESAKQSKDAKEASKSVLSKLSTFSQVIDFNEAISNLNEIRTLARNSTFGPIPEKIDRIVSALLRAKVKIETTSQAGEPIQNAISTLRALQGELELCTQQTANSMNGADILRRLTDIIDIIEPILLDFNHKFQTELS